MKKLKSKPNVIVYTSNTGHTERYAKMLGDILSLPVCSIHDAKKMLTKNERIIYMGWLFASNVKEYSKVKKHFDIKAVIGVGLCPTGALIDEVRSAINLPSSTPLFTLQGGMNYNELRGINKFMIDMLTKSIESKKEKDEKDIAMLSLLKSSDDYVSEENLGAVIEWFKNQE